MQINSLQQTSAAQSISRPSSTKSAGPVQSATPASSIPSDELDLSFEAQELIATQGSQSTSNSAGIRVDKVAALRQAIADGSYETPEKLDAALDKLLDSFA